ncbi:MFS transporter [Azospirillum doebereinerae]|uniref:MFS transporter n=1 Tax=Azospirillum doebereinerae TaxID=92933 RepID=A0A3S0XIQ1_9PROT|nr:MFS transporter [Azospirillum doebereinerae]RUQ63085.1 MFS transporter [Azospirillum doebereinerae]
MIPIIDALPTARQMDATTALFHKISWKILPFLFICYCVAYLDRINVAFAKLQMSQELAFSDAIYGLGAGIFFAGYLLFEVPSNMILERIGARIWIARIMITWGIINCLMAAVTTPTTFYILRFLLGVAEAGFAPGVFFLFTKWYPNSRRGRVFAVFFTAFPVVGLIGGPLSGLILDYFHGWANLSGWQWMFLIEGSPAVVLGILCLSILQNGPEEASWLSADEKAALKEQIDADLRPKEEFSFVATLRRPTIWLLSYVNFAIGAGFLGVAFWMPTLLKEAGFQSNTMIGFVSAIPYLFAFVLMLAVGWSADRMGERRYHLAVPLFVAALGLVLAAKAGGNPILVVLGLTISMAGVTAAAPMIWPLSFSLLSAKARAAGTAFITSALALAGFVMPYVVGLLRGMKLEAISSSDLALYVIAAILIGGSLVVLRFAPSKVNA